MATIVRLLLVALVACGGERSIELAPLVGDTGATVLVTRVDDGSIVASHGLIAAPRLPLSVMKLYTAALWWNHELGDAGLTYRGGPAAVESVLTLGWDVPGEQLAVALRTKLGAAKIFDELQTLGLTALTVPTDADDARWGAVFSIGERDVTVTPLSLATLLRAIGGGTSQLSRATQARMQEAMVACVGAGTAKGAAVGLPANLELAGKTGSGPAARQPYDGWFAGLVIVDQLPRYTISVFVPGHGVGGGTAAHLAAKITRALP